MSGFQRSALPFGQMVDRWAGSVGIAATARPDAEVLARFEARCLKTPTRPPASPAKIQAWEFRYGFALPEALRAWLRLSDGLYLDESTPLIHPLSSIGPMIPFARTPGLFVQPESWFELGNPGVETVCIDLAYRWPEGDCPLFTSGDDESGSPPRLIAAGFSSWLIELVRSGGQQFWFEPGFRTLGDPWAEHRTRVPAPPLPNRLQALAPQLRPLMRRDADERAIAGSLGISPGDVETIFRHLQHASP